MTTPGTAPMTAPVNPSATIAAPPRGEDHAALALRREEAPDVAELLGGPEEGDLRAGLDH